MGWLSKLSIPSDAIIARTNRTNGAENRLNRSEMWLMFISLPRQRSLFACDSTDAASSLVTSEDRSFRKAREAKSSISAPV